MEPINPQEPVSQDLMKQMESIKQMPPVRPVTPATSQPTTSGGVNYAGFWRRSLAIFIDGLLLWLLNIAIGIVLTAWTQPFYSDFYYFQASPSSFLQYFYNILLIGYTGQTVGKKIMGIKVVSITGERLNWGQVVVRELFKIVSGLALLLGYLWMLWDKDKQTWHDKVAKTYVIKLK